MELFCYLDKIIYSCNVQNNNFYNQIMFLLTSYLVSKLLKCHFRCNSVTSEWVHATGVTMAASALFGFFCKSRQ